MSAEVKSMKEWALYYAELGLAVFPLAYRNKVPAIEGGCKAATTEKSKIERWWNQNPRYNIGIATGNKSNGLVVIDLDVDKNKGIDGYLKQVITAITRTLGGLFDVLEASGTAGKIAAFLGKAFIAVKIADITGIGSLVKFLVTTIGKKLITEESVQALAGNISNLTNSALAGSTSGIATFASSLGSLVGTAGAITLVTAGTVMLTKKIAELVETAQGGNGILTQTGGYLHDYAGKMGEAHAITNKQVEELWALVEADETAGKSNSEMYDSMVQKLGEYGVSAEKATQILEQYGAQAGVSSAFVEEMTGKVQALGKGFSESSSTIDTSSITVKESIKGIRILLFPVLRRHLHFLTMLQPLMGSGDGVNTQ